MYRLIVLFAVLLAPLAQAADPVTAEAEALAQRALIVDTHIDVPYSLQEDWEDVTVRAKKGEFDWPRARAGGLNTPFMSIYTPATNPENAEANYQLANHLIDSVEALVGRAPDKFSIVETPEEARDAMAAGRIGLAMGMENGSPINGKLENVRFFRNRGISYITLAHSLANSISDSSYDKNRPNGGLSPFGREVVAEMNRVGIMVDVSHISDDAFWQVLDVSRAPVIASHSSARHFTPGFERNMSDDMITALAAHGGVIQINFGSSFLTHEAQQYYNDWDAARDAFVKEHGYAEEGPEVKEFQKQYRAEHAFPYASLDDLVAVFEYVIGLAGVEHVGIGSDFDGVGDSLPVGMKDVSQYPDLVAALLAKGHSEADIEAILGGNLLRVWGEVLKVAAGSDPGKTVDGRR